MKSWQERGRPYEGYEYTALTPHYFWDGRTHYWPGMTVKGSEDQDPDNPACCQDLLIYERGEVVLKALELEYLRKSLKKRGLTHRGAGRRMGMGLSRIRSRLYGLLPFRQADFRLLCRLAGVDPAGLERRDGGEEA